MSLIITKNHICDRCGNELVFYKSFKILRKKLGAQMETRQNWGNGYPIDDVLELCNECKKDFDVFMNGGD